MRDGGSDRPSQSASGSGNSYCEALDWLRTRLLSPQFSQKASVRPRPALEDVQVELQGNGGNGGAVVAGSAAKVTPNDGSAAPQLHGYSAKSTAI